MQLYLDIDSLSICNPKEALTMKNCVDKIMFTKFFKFNSEVRNLNMLERLVFVGC